MSYQNLLNNLGFKSDPFSKVNADEEEHLDEYFIEPPFFKAVYGITSDPKSYIVFAPRGSGKTALKRKIELNNLVDETFLCVTYNYFDTSNLMIENIDLDYHLSNILKIILIKLIPEINPDNLKNISKDDRYLLYYLTQQYFNDLNQSDLNSAINNIKNLNQKTKDWWNILSNPIEKISNVILSVFGLGKIELAKINESTINIGNTIDQLKFIQLISEKIGYESIYVLIDKIDENELTGSASNSYKFIESFLRNLHVLELEKFAFKFFLWDKIREEIQDSEDNEKIRFDRINNRNLSWNKKQLVEMLSRRLSVFSDNEITSLNHFFPESDDFDWDNLIVIFGMGSPRNIIRLCKEIIEQQSEIDSDATRISFGAVNIGIKTFSDIYTHEILSARIIAELLKVKKIDFTNSYIANNIFKVEHRSAIAKMKIWLDTGVVEQIGQIQLKKGQRPSHYYGITNILVAKHVFSDISLREFLVQKIKNCPSCNEILLRDWDISSQHRCHKCQENIT